MSTTKQITQLNSLYESLIKIKNKNKVIDKIPKVLNIISEIEGCLLIDNNNNSSLFVDAFLELNVLKEYNYLADLNNKDIIFALLKSFSILIASITKIHLLHFFYSNPLINKLILTDYSDEDFLSYQINFMKSLSLKLDKDTINFFFLSKNNFPLLEKTFRLRTHKDGMINNVVRNIILTLLKIDDAPLRKYFMSYPIIVYFPNLILNLKPKLINLSKANQELEYIKDLHDDVIDSLYYIQDIFSLEIEQINHIIYNCMLTQLILPLGHIIISTQKYDISITNALYFILLILYTMKEKAIVNVVFYLLFVENIRHDVIKMINDASFNEYVKPFQVVLLNKIEEGQPIDDMVDIGIFGFLLKECLYEVNNMTIPIINKVIDLEQLSNKDNVNDICWNLKLFLNNKDDTLVLLIGLLIHNVGNKNVDMSLVSKACLFKEYNLKIKEKKNLLIDYEPDEQLDVISSISSIQENTSLLDTLLPFITGETQFRFITTRIILTILSGIIIECKAKLTEKTKEQLSEIYCSIITVIKTKIAIVDNYKSISYELFIETYDDYKTNPRKSFENIVMKPWILLPYKLIEKNAPSFLHYNKTDYDLYKILILTFLSLYDYQAMIYSQPFITQEFPIPYEGREYNIGDKIGIDNHYEFCNCKVRQGNEVISSRMMIISNYFYLSRESSINNEFVIYTKIPLRRLLVKSEQNEEKTVLLIRERNLDERNKTQMQRQKELTFKTDDYCLSILAYITQQKETIIETEYLMLDSYLDNIFMMFIK